MGVLVHHGNVPLRWSLHIPVGQIGGHSVGDYLLLLLLLLILLRRRCACRTDYSQKTGLVVVMMMGVRMVIVVRLGGLLQVMVVMVWMWVEVIGVASCRRDLTVEWLRNATGLHYRPGTLDRHSSDV